MTQTSTCTFTETYITHNTTETEYYTQTTSVHTHSSFEQVDSDTDNGAITQYDGYWTQKQISCTTTYTEEKKPIVRGVFGLLWMITDSIMWGAFFLVKGKAMNYLETIRVEDNDEDYINNTLHYDENSIYNFDQSSFNF